MLSNYLLAATMSKPGLQHTVVTHRYLKRLEVLEVSDAN